MRDSRASRLQEGVTRSATRSRHHVLSTNQAASVASGFLTPFRSIRASSPPGTSRAARISLAAALLTRRHHLILCRSRGDRAFRASDQRAADVRGGSSMRACPGVAASVLRADVDQNPHERASVLCDRLVRVPPAPLVVNAQASARRRPHRHASRSAGPLCGAASAFAAKTASRRWAEIHRLEFGAGYGCRARRQLFVHAAAIHVPTPRARVRASDGEVFPLGIRSKSRNLRYATVGVNVRPLPGRTISYLYYSARPVLFVTGGSPFARR